MEEKGDTIYIFPKEAGYSAGQWVKLFSKNKNESLAETVESRFLTNKEKCKVTTEASPNLPPEFMKAEIELDESLAGIDPNEYYKTLSRCSTYASPGYSGYFVEDSKHPDRFAYFSIGHEAVMGNEKETWQDTFRFLE